MACLHGQQTGSTLQYTCCILAEGYQHGVPARPQTVSTLQQSGSILSSYCSTTGSIQAAGQQHRVLAWQRSGR